MHWWLRPWFNTCGNHNAPPPCLENVHSFATLPTIPGGGFPKPTGKKNNLENQRRFCSWRRRDGELGKPTLQRSQNWQSRDCWGGQHRLVSIKCLDILVKDMWFPFQLWFACFNRLYGLPATSWGHQLWSHWGDISPSPWNSNIKQVAKDCKGKNHSPHGWKVDCKDKSKLAPPSSQSATPPHLDSTSHPSKPPWVRRLLMRQNMRWTLVCIVNLLMI